MGKHVTSGRLPARFALVALLAAAAPSLGAVPAAAAGPGSAEVRLSSAAAAGPLTPQPTAGPRPIDYACPDPVPSAGFTDVLAGSTHQISIDCIVADWEVARGTAPGKYSPAANVSRAQMATFIANAIINSGDELPQPTKNWFEDDDGLGHHEHNINMLAEAGIIGGRSPGIYAPADQVARGTMTKFLVEAYKYTSGEQLPTTKDYFSDDNGTQFEDYINAAASVGIASGSGTEYRAEGLVRRDQMASFVARWLDLVVERLFLQEP
jgi:hypothetical protein